MSKIVLAWLLPFLGAESTTYTTYLENSAGERVSCQATVTGYDRLRAANQLMAPCIEKYEKEGFHAVRPSGSGTF
jgi:hypothetical protein